MKSYLFSIAGNIAAGKSTLTKALESRSNGKIVSFLERVDYVKENGYLQKYYEAVTAYDRIKGLKLDGKGRDDFLEVKREAEYWGYKIQETYFLSRLLDLGVLTELLREGQSVAQDRSIYEDQIFTKNSNNYEYITDADYRKYLDLFDLVMKDKPKPDLIIYLESDVEALKERIIGRSRGEEVELASPDNHYLANLNNLYRPWIMKCGLPYLVIDTEAIDFRTEAGLEKVIEGIVHTVPGAEHLFE
ncbi:MAG: deoxynucleoside kinase [Xanthomonadales bacterium]|nr:deoxynucleoside kinase [Gammaproteobacteria bacterium]MBT8050053.1 deoxynucleoside kinase [Gammaproteobacteria bacterium]MBT8056885.1 deoxynucleoside kinase [Gammaproteobacteria bacterium]NNJ78290.1 deoxynucleoside kinase [Xanthomonadales bacterium]NNL05082.1 deoxynucleoside kinase [Xanthomonadales bacterium]